MLIKRVGTVTVIMNKKQVDILDDNNFIIKIGTENKLLNNGLSECMLNATKLESDDIKKLTNLIGSSARFYIGNYVRIIY